MKKVLAALILCLVLVLSVFADSLVYVYGNSISSNDFTATPKRGQVFVDESSNVIIVKSVRDDIIVFDKLVSREDYQRNSSLSPRGPLNSLNIIGSLGYSFVSYSITSPIYPFCPVVMVGASYGNTLGISVVALAGLDVMVPIARLWDSENTFIENGKLVGWGAVGASISSAVTFASGYGFSYRHNIGNFNWEVGAAWLLLSGKGSEFSPYIGVGLSL